jgi:hypothetical protein
MGTEEALRYSVYVVLRDEDVGTLPQMRRRNPDRDSLKPFVYVGLTSLHVDCRFDFRIATNKTEWRLHQYGGRLMPVFYEHLHPMTVERALRAARKLAEDLTSKGFGVATGTRTGSQSYKSILTKARHREVQSLSSPNCSTKF